MSTESPIICDSTLPWMHGIASRTKRLKELERRRKLGFTYVSLTVGGPYDHADELLRFMAQERRWIESLPDRFRFAENTDDIRQARRDGCLALGFHLQGTSPLDGDVALVQAYYRLGVRHMLLAYNTRNLAGDGCLESEDNGLSGFGRQVVSEMNRIGMLVDCSHTGYRTSWQALEHSASPVIFSHSNARAVRDHPRNLPDDLIKACAAQDGWIGITGVGRFLKDPQDNSTEAFIGQLEYVGNLVGPRYVGIGLDHIFVGEERNQEVLEELAGGGSWGKTLSALDPPPPYTWVQPEQIASLAEALAGRGWADADIRGVLGENFLRVAQAVWK